MVWSLSPPPHAHPLSLGLLQPPFLERLVEGGAGGIKEAKGERMPSAPSLPGLAIPHQQQQRRGLQPGLMPPFSLRVNTPLERTTIAPSPPPHAPPPPHTKGLGSGCSYLTALL